MNLRSVFATALLFAPLALRAQVILTSPASPSTAEPGVTLVTLTGSNFPSGSILPAQVSVRMEPQTINAGPTATIAAAGIQTVAGTTRRVTFTVPATVVVSVPTAYNISVTGSTTTGTTFNSNSSQLNVQAVPGILSSVPPAIQAGQAAAMLVRTQQGNFVQGAADALLGAGISVGVSPIGTQAPDTAPFGTPGRVIVVDQNTLLAVVRASGGSVLGSRELTVRQGPATYRRPDAIAVQSTPAVNTSTSLVTLLSPASPDAGIPGVTTFTLTASGLPTGTLQAAQVRLFLEPLLDSTATPSVSVTLISVSAETSGQRSLTFQVPSTLAFTAQTDYAITLYGSTSNYGQLSSGQTFLSGNRALIRLGPPSAPAPVLSSLTPFAGLQGQTLTVAIAAQNTAFVQGQTVAAFGPGISVGGATAGQFGPVTVTSATLATAQIQIQPGASIGPRDIDVRTGTQSASLRSGFQVLQGSTVISISAVQPATSRPGSTVQLTASGFPAGTLSTANATIVLAPARSGAGPSRTVPLTTLSADNAGSRQATFVVPADLVFAQPENYFVSISGTSPSGVTFSTQLPASLTIQPPPRLLSATPNTGQRGQTLSVAIQGEFTNFQNGSSTASFGAGITIGSVSVVSATTLTASVTIAANAAAGPRTVTVIGGPDTSSLPNGFTVSGAPISLTLSSATTPTSARPGEQVSVQATNFPSGDVLPTQVTIVLEAVSGGATLNVSPVSIQDNGNNVRLLRFSIPSTLAITATANYLVSISGANSMGVAFVSGNKSALAIQPPALVPSVSAVTPNQGFQGQTLTLAITGQNTSFSNATQVSLGTGISTSSVTVNSATALSVQVTIAALASVGPRDVVVTTGTQIVTLSNGFTIAPSIPSISSATPAQGNTGQTLAVTVNGQSTHFSAGATQVSFGAGITVSSVAVQNPLSLTAQLSIASTAVAGNRTITVTTGNEIATGTDRFAVVAATPTLTSISPSTGNPGQSLSVTITGQNTAFLQGTSQVSFGAGITVSSVTVASTTSLTAQVAIAADAAVGSRAVSVTTGTQVITSAQGFQVAAPTGTLTLTSVTPALGATGTNVDVTVTGSGTGFQQGQSVVSFGAGISPGPITVANATQLFTRLTIAPDAGPGSRIVTVTTGAEVASLTNGFTVIGPQITLLSPTDKSFVNTPSITVSGSVNDNTATVAVNGVSAPNVNGSFTVAIPLSEGNNTVTAVATTTGGATSSTSALVNLDTTPPRVAVLTPLDGDETTEDRINVAGNVNDIVVGTVNDLQAQVTVNGVAAEVNNRSFVAKNVPLQAGVNTIQIVARDRVGNAFTTSLKVNHVMAPLLKLSVVSGNDQTARINAPLPHPVVVRLTDGLGIPKPNTTVYFRVAGNNGRVALSSGQTGALAVETRTDSQGNAEAYWTLGSRSGAGVNRLEVGSTGVTAPSAFTATGQPSVASRIVVDSGLNQTGAVGQKLPLPFVAVVIDEGNNRLAGVPVNFEVRSGGGRIEGQSSLNLTSDPDGRIAATLTMGPQEGHENNEAVATFDGNVGTPAIFTASGRVPGPISATRVTGLVLDNANQPIAGVTMKLLRLYQGTTSNLPQQASQSVLTDDRGLFDIPNAPVGVFKLLADGTTAASPNRYPTLEFDITAVAGQNNSLRTPIYLPTIDTRNQLCVDENSGGTLTLPDVPGFALRVGAGSATFPGGSKTGCVSVTPVNIDKVPMAPGFGQQPRFVVTIQPVGTTFNPPAGLTIPNVDGLGPGKITEMYSYDHDLATFVSIGNGQVSSDGLVVASVGGSGVSKAGWHCGGDPAAAGHVADCPECNFCSPVLSGPNAGKCVPDPSQEGRSCQNDVCKICFAGSCLLKAPQGIDPHVISLLLDTSKRGTSYAVEVTPLSCNYIGTSIQEEVTVFPAACAGNILLKQALVPAPLGSSVPFPQLGLPRFVNAYTDFIGWTLTPDVLTFSSGVNCAIPGEQKIYWFPPEGAGSPRPGLDAQGRLLISQHSTLVEYFTRPGPQGSVLQYIKTRLKSAEQCWLISQPLNQQNNMTPLACP